MNFGTQELDMGLSEWPEKWSSSRPENMETVLAVIDMYVKVVTDKAVGFVEDIDDDEVDLWIPLSKVDDVFDVGDYVEDLEMPRWLAADKNLDF